jgi:hypothetical protein
VNQRFVQISESVSSALGHYLFSIISLAILIAWTIYGATAIASQLAQSGQNPSSWFTSQAWNFPLNDHNYCWRMVYRGAGRGGG